MRKILSLGKYLYLKKVSIFFIAVVLIAGLVSCSPTPPAEYDLTMAANPTAGGTATDETGTSPYEAGDGVSIKAVPAAGYEFVNWSAPAGTFTDANAAETTFAMPAQDVTVTANFVLVYELIMAVNPAGGGVATDLTDESPYPEDTDVSIKAVPNAGYQFFSWTAPAGTLADANAAETTFTMPAQDVIVTANFVGSLDHFTCYEAEDVTGLPVGEVVYLEDQFGAVNATVLDAIAFGNPAEKLHGDVFTPILNPDHHLTVYTIDYSEEPQIWQVEVDNQFGIQQLIVYGPVGLAVPTQKVVPGDHGQPLGLDHFLLYEVLEGSSVNVVVNLTDQFGEEAEEIQIYEPWIFANPARKTHGDEVTEILNPEAHAVIYGTDVLTVETQVQVVNQFGEQTLDVDGPGALAVPSQKLSAAVMLDHFKFYDVLDLYGPIGESVYLEDQFGAVNATVLEAQWFGNPVEKLFGDDAPILHPDYHLTVYNLVCEEAPQAWVVEVDNQFGPQALTVWGPVALAVPTQKLDPWGHESPVGLDHFLLYEVTSGPALGFPVTLIDEFGFEPEVWVTTPHYFANPVLKIRGEEDVTEIMNPGAHLVFYDILGGTVYWPYIFGINQFRPQELLDAFSEPGMLAVPSLKLSYELAPE